MTKEKRKKLIKKVLQECIIYPKAHPEEIDKEIVKINNIVENSNAKFPSEDKLISRLSKSFDIKQRIKNEKEWIKYVEN